jgi:hypothetical protein
MFKKIRLPRKLKKILKKQVIRQNEGIHICVGSIRIYRYDKITNFVLGYSYYEKNTI